MKITDLALYGYRWQTSMVKCQVGRRRRELRKRDLEVFAGGRGAQSELPQGVPSTRGGTIVHSARTVVPLRMARASTPTAHSG